MKGLGYNGRDLYAVVDDLGVGFVSKENTVNGNDEEGEGDGVGIFLALAIGLVIWVCLWRMVL